MDCMDGIDGMDGMDMTAGGRSIDGFYTVAELHSAGFTDKMIHALLPYPWLILGKRRRVIKIWREDIVEEVMRQPAFVEMRDKHLKRCEAAAKGIRTKQALLMEEAGEAAARLKKPKRLRYDTLRKYAIREKNDQFLAQGVRGYAELAPDDIVRRWMVNYVRHNLMDYDDLFHELLLRGRVGRALAESVFRRRAYELTMKVYPELRHECEEQMRARGVDPE